MGNEVLLEVDGGIAVVTLNRPDRLNAIDAALAEMLADAISNVESDDSARCVIITGSGRAFCAGGDTAAIKSRAGSPNVMRRVLSLQSQAEIYARLHEMSKPTIAMINGACAGAAMSLAGACDFRFASKSAVFTTAYQKIGLSGDGGGSWYWTRILGTASARRLYLLSERIDADAALRMGLIHELWPDEELRERTFAIARSLADAPRSSIVFAKQALNAAEDGHFAEVKKIEAMSHALSGLARAAEVARENARGADPAARPDRGLPERN